MKNLFIIYFLFGFYFVSFSQEGGSGSMANMNDIRNYLNPMQNDGLFVSVKSNASKRDITQYLFPENEGNFKIFFLRDNGFSIKNLNYNINSKTLESIMDKDSIFQFNSDKIDFILHNSIKYKFYDFNEGRQLYEELFVADKVIFLKGYKLVYKDAFINPMTNALISEARNEIKEKYFCKISDKDFKQFDLKKNSVLKLFGKSSSEIEKFVSSSKLSYSSEEDLVKIFNYYNTL
jgi:hypothetical protein